MKKSYLLLYLILINFSLKSQTIRVDYENSSKWFFGLNMGGTWNTTDVKSKTNVGWGLTLGKSYGFNSYSPFTIDLRARYLRGYWYGQDYDTSYINAAPNSVLAAYNNQGMIVHNFQSDVHRLAMELALHINAITKRTGWDPYVFGGIGLTWHQVNGNLYNQSDSTTNSTYDYSSMLNSTTSLTDQITNSLDEIYDTPLDGYSSKSFNVAFMPSLGFGLGYHIGKRTTLGIEHKTTFTLRDDFDGLTSTVQPKNDRYHYTSLYLRFRFRGKRPRTESSNVPCYAPQITLIQPNSATSVVNPQYTIEATVSNVRNSNQISVVSNNGSSIPFQYNASTNKVLINVLLLPGQNSYTIRVNTSCGSDMKVANINFINCNLPSAVFTNPSLDSMMVRNAGFTLTAAVNGVADLQGVKLFQNNVAVNGYSYNSTNGLFQSNVTLVPGINTFTLQLSNGCGTNYFVTHVNYNNCVNPSIALISPSATGTTVNNSAVSISSMLTGISAKNQVSITQNNVTISQFTFANNKVDFSTNLTNGINTFTISANNACGNTSQTFTINYQTCNAPIITLENPSTTGSNATTSSLKLQAKILNIDSKQNVVVSLNGLAIKNTTFTKSTNSLEVPLSLQNGANTITVTATNSCGADVETTILNYNPCVAPTITLSTMNSAVTTSSYTFTASILNQPSNQGISLTLNGLPVNYSYSNGTISSSVNLQNGSNVFVLSALNTCGNASKTWTVSNSNCSIPSIALVNPTATGTTTNNAAVSFKASISGMTTSQGIVLSLNGTPVTVNYENGIVTNELSLINGANTIKLSVQNACGNDSEEIVINFQNCQSPSITINQPIEQNTTVNQASISLNASITNISANQNVTVKLNGIGVSSQFTNNVLTSNFNLKPGPNTILVTATNDCGTDVEAINLNYNECNAPQVTISNSTTSTADLNFTLNAVVTGTNVSQGITLTQNGNTKSYTLNGNNLTSSLTLIEGENTFSISLVNSCGSDVKTYTITYTPCRTPSVSITNPASSNLTVNTGNFTFQGQISNVNSINEISLTQNGTSISNVSFSNGQLVAPLNLTVGQNTIKLSASTSCGNDSKTIVITGKSCDAPILTLVSSENVNVVSPSYNLQATVLNVPSNQGILISLNGTNVTNYLFNNGNISSNLSLLNGTNTIVLSASNQCGNVNKVFNINFILPIEQEEKITICHIPPGNANNPQTIEIPLSAWPAHQAHGDVMGACVANNSNGNGGNGNNNSSNDTNNGSTSTDEQKITICHIPPGNPNNPQTIEIPMSAWPAHQAHGDVMGACVANNSNGNGTNSNGNGGNGNNNSSNDTNNGSTSTDEQKITICHIPPGNPNNPQTIEIPMSAWPAHQAHGDVMGACVANNSNGNGSNSNGNAGNGNNNTSNDTNSGSTSTDEQKITICHIPPGNPNNPQTIEIPMSAWPAHQAHGDVMGACVANNSNGNGSNSNGNAGNGNNNTSNDTNSGSTSTDEQKITICHIPPGNPNNPQTIEIPMSAWPAHQAHGDVMGACPENNNSNGSNNNGNSGGSNNQGNGNSNGSNNNQGETNSNENNSSTSQTITICHKHQGRMGNNETMTITIEEWPEHEAHGDFIGTCSNIEPIDDNSNDNNNGSGNGNPETNGNQNNSENNNNSNGNSGSSGNGNPETNGNQNNSENNNNSNGNSGSSENGNPQTNGNQNNSDNNNNSNGNSGGSGNGNPQTNGSNNSENNGNSGGNNGNGNQRQQSNPTNTRGGGKPTINPSKQGNNPNNEKKNTPEIKPEVKPDKPKTDDKKPPVNPGVKRGGN